MEIRSMLERLFSDGGDKGVLGAVLNGSFYDSESISKSRALCIPAVATALNFVAGTVAGLPVRLYRKSGQAITPVEDDYRLQLLNGNTNDLLDATQMKRALVTDMLLMGAGYAVVEREENRISGIYYVDEQFVNVIPSMDPVHKTVRIYIQGTEYRDFEILRVTRQTVDGVSGQGILKQNGLFFNTMYNALKYENKTIRSGAKRGFLKSKYKLDDASLQNLKKAWRALYDTERMDTPNVMVLNEGISFEPASATASENQLNESKRTNTELVYNLFGLTTNLFDTTTVNSDVYINAVKTGILPVVAAMNNALNKFLLLEEEKGRLFFEMDTSDILKSTVEERYKSYELALKSGWLQVDEVRKMENLPPLGLDFVKLGLADVLYYPKTKEIYTPNMATKSNLTKTEVEGGEKTDES